MAGLSVSDVTAEFLESFLQSKQRGGYSAQTVNNIRALVSVIFTRAKEAGRWRGPNPARETRKRRVGRRAYDFLRPHEVAPVLESAQANYGPVVTCAFALALYAGLRRGEVAGLKKNDVDLAAGTLTVRRSHGQERTKGNVDVVLPVHPDLARHLQSAMGATSSEFVCPGDIEAGSQMPEHFDLEGRLRRTMADARVGVTGYVHHCRAWHCKFAVKVADEKPRSCERHGLEHMLVTPQVRPLGFHDLRRSHASLLAHAGVSTAVTQKLIGTRTRSSPSASTPLWMSRRCGERSAVSTSSRFLPGSYRTGQKPHRRPGVLGGSGPIRCANPKTWRK
ncbi:MAG: tyrosine-type recombinase/integrase [Myxococcaceae bacterium]